MALVIDDLVQAKLLSDETSFGYFEPFVAKEKSASQAAAELGCKLETLLYRIGTFLKAGLLKIVREEPRRGRPIKIYRSSADSYFVSFAATSYASIEERLHEFAQERNAVTVPALARALSHMGFGGQLIYRHAADDEVWRRSSSHPEAEKPEQIHTIFERLLEGRELKKLLDAYHGPLATDFFSTLNLSRDEAKDFMQKLYGLWLEYSLLPLESARDPYHFAVTFVKSSE